MNTTTKAQRINKRQDAIWEAWLGGNGKDTVIQPTQLPMQHFKTTKLKSGFFRCRIVETGYYGHGSTPGEARLSALRLQEGNEPIYKKRLANGLELTESMQLERERDQFKAQRDELLAAAKEARMALTLVRLHSKPKRNV